MNHVFSHVLLAGCLLLTAITFPLSAHEDHYMLKDGEVRPPIADPTFAQAVAMIDAGDAVGLAALLAEHPDLITQIATGDDHPEYARGYFANPTLLHFVAYNPWFTDEIKPPANLVEVTTVILDAGAEVDAMSGDQPGWLWATLGLVTSSSKVADAGLHRPMIELLVERGADPTKGIDGAVAYQFWDAFDALVELGAQRTPTVLAVLNETDALREGLANADETELHRALFAAVFKGNPESVRVTLEAGADPNAFLPIHQHGTAMHQAAFTNHVEVLKVLVEHGGRFDIKDKIYGGTPTGWAAHHHNAEALTYLIDVAGIQDATPQMLAAWGQTDALRKHLQAHPDDLESVNDWGTCLQQASFHARVDTVKMLLELGADVNNAEGGDRVPGGGTTPLDKAVATDRQGANVAPEDAAAVAAMLREHGGVTGKP